MAAIPREYVQAVDNQYAHMVHEACVDRVRAVMEERRRRIDSLKTRADALAYVREIRGKIRRVFGPQPVRTPLAPRVISRESCRHYDLEKITYYSRPHLLVTANLYLPKGVSARGKAPCVLGLCGHAPEGKAAPFYQSFAQGLAIKGFVVFIIDPIAQGERQQYFARGGGPGTAGVRAHDLMGHSMVLVDDFFGAWRAWDAIRGLDYLLSRPEVDRHRVGVTGNSGGGTLTTYVTALDPRPTMAAPSCYICSYLANLQNELTSDAEQNPPGILAAGLDQVDMLLCHAPRPTLILGQQDDFFDERYARAAAEDVKRVHALLGSNGSAGCFIGTHGHGFYPENREAMYGFFLKHAGLNGSAREIGVKPVAVERLCVLGPGGLRATDSRPVYEFTAETARSLRGKRGRPTLKQVRSAAFRLLNITLPRNPPFYRALRREEPLGKGVTIRGQYAVETEPGILALVTGFGQPRPFSHPPAGRVCLYVGHSSGKDDILSIPEIRTLASGRIPLLAVDPRGMGQSRCQSCRSVNTFDPLRSDDLYAAAGEMLGESYLGRRVFDVLRTVDFLRAGGATDIRLVGRGMGSVVAAFAALLHPSAPRVHLLHYLPSYELIAASPQHRWPLSCLLRGCLRFFDLPDVYRMLGRRLTLHHPWNELMQSRESTCKRGNRR